MTVEETVTSIYWVEAEDENDAYAFICDVIDSKEIDRIVEKVSEIEEVKRPVIFTKSLEKDE
jgi:L-lactate utilization protein LutB